MRWQLLEPSGVNARIEKLDLSNLEPPPVQSMPTPLKNHRALLIVRFSVPC